jgi:amino acid transporter
LDFGLALSVGVAMVVLLEAMPCASLLLGVAFLVFLGLRPIALIQSIRLATGTSVIWSLVLIGVLCLVVPWDYSTGSEVKLTEVLPLAIGLGAAAWPVIVLFTALCTLWSRLRTVTPEDACVACGYSTLQLGADRCPECGAPLKPAAG